MQGIEVLEIVVNSRNYFDSDFVTNESRTTLSG